MAAQVERVKPSILLVDDHPENLLALEEVLKDLDARIVKAQSGREALRHALDQDFAVILLDVQMPDMDGFETAELIRQRERSRRTPIIFLTAVSKAEAHVFKGYATGAVDYILKPFVPDVMKAKVAVFLELYDKAEQIKEQARKLQELERAEHRKELDLAEERRRRFFSLSLDLMAIVGFDGFLKEVNPAWEGTLGYSKAELLSRPFIKLAHQEDWAATREFFSDVRTGGKGPWVFENRFLAKDGTYRWLFWNAVAQPQEEAFYATARDITDRKKAEQALRSLNEGLEQKVAERTQELRRSNFDLEQFAYVASHDLREPLRKVASFSELLDQNLKGKLDDTSRGYLGYILDGVTRMQGLISDLLEYSRVGRGEKPAETVDCGAVMEKALANLGHALQESGGKVTHDSLPTIKANPTELSQLFQNLIGNALKFHGKAPPEVHVSAKTKDADWVFSVRDNGIGIEPKHHDRIFTMFKRLHTRDQYPGTGIGLAICKKVVERNGGRIWVESEPGRGATFYFTVPRSPSGSA